MDNPDDDTELRISALTEALRKVTASSQTDNATKALRFVYALGVVLFTTMSAVAYVAVWAAHNTEKNDAQDRQIGETNARIEREIITINSIFAQRLSRTEALEKYTTQNERVLDAVKSRIDDNRKELDDRKPLIERVTQMWSMLKRGESNKEAFFIEKGYEAPSMIPASQPPTVPAKRPNTNN